MSTPAPTELAGLTLEACEWLPSGTDGGLLRVRGRWAAEPAAVGLPSLWITSEGAPHRFDSLPDTRFARDAAVWRGTYVVPASLIAEGPGALWLAWPSGARVTLSLPDFASPPPVPLAAEEAGDDGPGGEVIDRAVLADRRARRAEASERKQTRLAAEALRAVEALERRLEALQAGRDAPPAAPTTRPFDGVAAEAATRQVARVRAAFATAARVRGQAQEWRLHARAGALLREAPRLTPRDQLAAEAVARAALDAQLDRERARLTAAHRAHAADRARLAGLEADLAAERGRRTAAETALEAARAEARRESGSLTARIAALDRHAAGLASELERRAREQAEAAGRVARPAPERAQQAAAALDAAAAALRERVPAPDPAPDPDPEETTSVAAAREDATSVGATPVEATPVEATPVEATPVEATPVEATPVGNATPGDATSEEAPSEEAAPVETTSGHATSVGATPKETLSVATTSGDVTSAREAAPAGHPQTRHRLRGALVRLAREDPVTAGRILAELLPAQAIVLERAVDYDLTIREVGTFAITVAGGRAWVKPLDAPRGRRTAEFHVSAGALALTELLTGAPVRLRRFSGPQRMSGRRRRLRPVLAALVNARVSLAEAAHAGARLDAELVMSALAHVIDPGWTRGHNFTIEQRVGEAVWFLVARDAGGLAVTRTAPERAPDATVVLAPEGVQRLLRGESAPRGERPVVRGDRAAVALLKAWTDRARGA